MKVNSQLHAPATVSSEEKIRGIHWTEGWVGLRVGLDGVGEKKYILAYYAWPRTSSTKVTRKEKKSVTSARSPRNTSAQLRNR